MAINDVLVVGSTGTQGGAVARHLLERGLQADHDVAFARLEDYLAREW